MTLDRATGAMTQVHVKPGDWDVLAGRGNVVTRQQDRGDLWELYRGLDGGSRIAMTTKQPVPKRGQAAFSDEGKGEPGTVRTGPVFSEFQVDRRVRARPVRHRRAGLSRACAGSRSRPGWSTARSTSATRSLFPTSIKGGKTTHEIPFGAIERPSAIEFPAQNWADLGDGRHGLALLNIGLPGNLTTDGTMMISLLRSHNLGAYGFGGGYEPGMSSESGFQVGQERTLRYALVPHAGDWREAGVFRDGMEFNHPLLARKVLPHAGSLPARWGLLEVSSPNVVVSALKPGRDGTAVLRVYEAAGRPAPGVKIAFNARVVEARPANLLEDPEGELKVENNAVSLDLRPYQIRTIRLRLGER